MYPDNRLTLPLVSVIVRSMGRPELRLALESIAQQDYPNVEVIVVDATDGSHPALPAIAWQSGHSIRIVGGHCRLPRPQAANEGLQAVNGE
jgi:cellulose synthase/poly-beta-1,6-N-acetylglucosamine synthase-like glycosyltransferase